jgi:hypothetical protein
VPLRRVTRNRFGRRLHGWLDAVGITVSRLQEYRAPIPDGYVAEPPDGVTTRPVDPDGRDDAVPVGELTDEETVLVAVDDVVVGYLFVSVDATVPVPVPELNADIAAEGACVRRR